MEENKKPLIERLSFTEHQPELYLDGKLLFTTPETHSGTRGINVLGVDETNDYIDIGTGECCYGYIHRLTRYEKDRPFSLDIIRPVDFNIYDLLPVIHARTDLPNQQSLLAVGHGCAGAGIRLIGMYTPSAREFLSASEYSLLKPKGSERVNPSFEISNGDIYLNLTGVARGFGPERNPDKPNMLHDLSDRIYSIDFKSIDLTQKLADLGIDIEKTLEFTKNYERTWGE